MKLITRDIDYAIRALCYMGREDKRLVSVQELVACMKIPKPFLRKILQLLNKKGLVISHRGKGGGFKLSRLPGNISILDVVEVFQGHLSLSDHTFKRKKCPNIKTCMLKDRLDIIQDFLRKELKNIKIKLLIKSMAKY